MNAQKTTQKTAAGARVAGAARPTAAGARVAGAARPTAARRAGAMAAAGAAQAARPAQMRTRARAPATATAARMHAGARPAAKARDTAMAAAATRTRVATRARGAGPSSRRQASASAGAELRRGSMRSAVSSSGSAGLATARASPVAGCEAEEAAAREACAAAALGVRSLLCAMAGCTAAEMAGRAAAAAARERALAELGSAERAARARMLAVAASGSPARGPDGVRTAAAASDACDTARTMTGTVSADGDDSTTDMHLALAPGATLKGGRYHVVCALGRGGYSRVWLCWDRTTLRGAGRRRVRTATDQFVAVKVHGAARFVTDAARAEVDVYRYLADKVGDCRDKPLTELLDCFWAAGAAGARHVCTAHPVYGEGLHEMADRAARHTHAVRSGRAVDAAAYAAHVAGVRRAMAGLLEGLAVLRDVHVVHADLKPDNVLLAAVAPRVRRAMRAFQDEAARAGEVEWAAAQLVAPNVDADVSGPYVRISDFGLACVLRGEGTRTHTGVEVRGRGVGALACGAQVQTRPYRAPEVLVGEGVTCGADVWSAGCVAYELLTGRQLVDREGALAAAAREEPRAAVDAMHLDTVHFLLGVGADTQNTRAGWGVAAHYDARGRYRRAGLVQGALAGLGMAGAGRYDLAEDIRLQTAVAAADAREAAGFVAHCLGGTDGAKRRPPAACMRHAWLAVRPAAVRARGRGHAARK